MVIGSLKKYSKAGLILLLLLLCAACIIGCRGTSRLLLSQRAAERWQGEGEMEFAQVNCYLPADDKLSLNDVYELRNAMYTKIHEASLDVDNDNTLLLDAWSADGSVNVRNGQRSGDVSVTAVGGDFFRFHPLRLISGNYIEAGDLMKDRVLLDEETAWLLFGGTELSGMSFKINGVPFVVAGVVQRETDRFSKRAISEGRCIYMSYDAYTALIYGDDKSAAEAAAIGCYELVMPEPVKNFAYGAVTEKFPVKRAELVNVARRYEPETIWRLLKDFNKRSMRLSAAAYPYWENAARGAEDTCARLMLCALMTGILPIVLLLVFVIKSLWRGKTKLEDDIIPKIKEQAEEALRRQGRKRWEKKNPDKAGK